MNRIKLILKLTNLNILCWLFDYSEGTDNLSQPDHGFYTHKLKNSLIINGVINALWFHMLVDLVCIKIDRYNNA